MRNLWPYNIEFKHWRSRSKGRVKRRKSLKACDKTV